MDSASFVRRGGAVLVGLALCVLGGRYLLPALLPFLGGAAVAVLLRPLACRVRRVTGMRYRPAAVTACLLFYGLFCLLVCNLGFLLFAQTVAFFTRLPELFAQMIVPTASTFWEQSARLFARLLPSTGAYLGELSSWISTVTGDTLAQVSAVVLHWATATVAGLPGLLLNLSLGVLSSFFILMDYDSIALFLFRQLSPQLRKVVRSSKGFLLSTGKNVVKAYFLLMLLTCAEVSLGLWLLGVPYFAVLGLVVGLVDILPILGSGAVLVPWGLWLVLGGNLPQGIGILLLYAVVTVVRTMAEPHILGDRLGLPPLVTVLSMYGGLRLFGVMGLVLTPMVMTLLVHLNRKGLLTLWKGGEEG